MNTVKDFTIGQRVSTDLGDGTVSKIGRVYVYVDIDGSDKTEKMTPDQLSDLAPADEIPAVDDKPVMVLVDEAHAMLGQPLSNVGPADGRPPMRIKGKRADADNRRAARKAQRASRRKNRAR